MSDNAGLELTRLTAGASIHGVVVEVPDGLS